MASNADPTARRNRFESGSLDLLIQVCEDKVGPEGALPGSRRPGHAMSIGSMSFGSMSDLGAMTGFKPQANLVGGTDGIAPMHMEYMESNTAGTKKGRKKAGTATKGRTAKKGTKGNGRGNGKGKGNAGKTSPAGAKKRSLKFKMQGKPTGHALDVGGWQR